MDLETRPAAEMSSAPSSGGKEGNSGQDQLRIYVDRWKKLPISSVPR